MEKGTPHFRLSVVKWLLQSGQVRTTMSSIQGAQALGLDRGDMLAVVEALSSRDFHKSMTTYADHRLWQDVYLPMTDTGRRYVKLTVSDRLLIISFKEA